MDGDHVLVAIYDEVDITDFRDVIQAREELTLLACFDFEQCIAT